MSPLIQFVRQNWTELLNPSDVTAITFLFGLGVHNVLFRFIRRWVSGT